MKKQTSDFFICTCIMFREPATFQGKPEMLFLKIFQEPAMCFRAIFPFSHHWPSASTWEEDSLSVNKSSEKVWRCVHNENRTSSGGSHIREGEH